MRSSAQLFIKNAALTAKKYNPGAAIYGPRVIYGRREAPSGFIAQIFRQINHIHAPSRRITRRIGGAAPPVRLIGDAQITVVYHLAVSRLHRIRITGLKGFNLSVGTVADHFIYTYILRPPASCLPTARDSQVQLYLRMRLPQSQNHNSRHGIKAQGSAGYESLISLIDQGLYLLFKQQTQLFLNRHGNISVSGKTNTV